MLYNKIKDNKGCDGVAQLRFESTHQMISQIRLEEGLFQRALEANDEAIWFYDSTLPASYTNVVINSISPARRFGLPPREASKSLSVYAEMIEFLDLLKPARNTKVIALGGGALCDAVAFVASTYLRGLPLTLIPTTLLAMVDAAIGGKTALNTEYKNRIGTFYPAQEVWVDPVFLSTLDETLMAEGMSEIIKVAAVFDATFFEALEQKKWPMEKVIAHAIRLKIDCAQADLTDQGTRQLLNFGHTLGHALESYHQYGYPHGQCVGAGMVLMTQDQPFGPRLRRVLEQYHAFVPIPYQKETLLAYVLGDKKRQGSQLTLIRLNRIGEGVLVPIELDALSDYVEEAYR